MTDNRASIDNFLKVLEAGLVDRFRFESDQDLEAAAEAFSALIEVSTASLVALANMKGQNGLLREMAGALIALRGGDRAGKWVGFDHAKRLWAVRPATGEVIRPDGRAVRVSIPTD